MLRVCLDIVYFAKNWKHCSKIIFKCVTNAVGSIFNESFVEKKKFVGSVNSARDPLEKQKKAGAHSQKTKKGNAKTQTLGLF